MAYQGDFYKDLAMWANAFIAAENAKRYKEERLKSLEAEIIWIDRHVAKLQPLLERRPRTIKQINELKHQKRKAEIEIAFL